MDNTKQFEYQQIGRWLQPWETSRLITSISESPLLEMVDGLPDGKLNYIFLRDTAKPRGYLGETIKLI